MTAGPIRKRHMIVPEARYEFSACNKEKSTGMMKRYADKDDRNGAKGLWVMIRP